VSHGILSPSGRARLPATASLPRLRLTSAV